MTALLKRVQRSTTGTHRGRTFTVILEPGDIIGFRHHKRRKVYYTSLAACFDRAVKEDVAAEKAAKKAKRLAKAGK